MYGGFMKVNLKKGMTCGDIFHAGYFIRYTLINNADLIITTKEF